MAQRDGDNQLNLAGLELVGILAAWELNESTRSMLLLVGLATFAGGILLMFRHQREIREIQAKEKDQRIVKFEFRKFRRRTTTSSLLAALGVFLASLYWITAPRVLVVMVSLIMILLLGILGMAFIDMTSVGLQALSNTDNKKAREQLVADYQRRREEADAAKEAAESED